MICYKNRSYCIANCSQSECTDMITEEVQDKAIRTNLPLSMIDYSDICKDYKEIPDTISISDMLLLNEEETWLIPH